MNIREVSGSFVLHIALLFILCVCVCVCVYVLCMCECVYVCENTYISDG